MVFKAIKKQQCKNSRSIKTHRTTNGCIQIGYYDDVELCEGGSDTRPRCYNSTLFQELLIKVLPLIASV
jgi:hypothetical protein